MVVSQFTTPSTAGTARALRSIGVPWRLWLPLVSAARQQSITRRGGVVRSQAGIITFQRSYRFALANSGQGRIFVTFPRGQ